MSVLLSTSLPTAYTYLPSDCMGVLKGYMFLKAGFTLVSEFCIAQVIALCNIIQFNNVFNRLLLCVCVCACVRACVST